MLTTTRLGIVLDTKENRYRNRKDVVPLCNNEIIIRKTETIKNITFNAVIFIPPSFPGRSLL